MSKYEHGYGHESKTDRKGQKKLIFCSFLIFIFMIVEVYGGIVSGSMALLSDAGHMLSDFGALVLAYFGALLSLKKPDNNKTFGYSRFSILVAFTNAIFMLFVCFAISYHAIERIINPTEITPISMISVALVGLVVNVVVFLILHSGSNNEAEDLNIKSAAIHVLGDLLGSIAAVLAGVIIHFTGWNYIDPLLSILIVLIIFNHAITMIRKTSHILLQGKPENISINELKATLREYSCCIEDVDHIHVWEQDDKTIIATMHIKAKNPICFHSTKNKIRKFLHKEYGIDHVTIEVELDAK